MHALKSLLSVKENLFRLRTGESQKTGGHHA
jgi:hypothetical protein